ncbi:MAG: response regulator [Deltaproteobacteria bacterium]|nr:response regulator [Deltaproteobacteria bacterium]
MSRRILIAEPSRTLSSLIRLTLDVLPVELEFAVDGREAVGLVGDDLPALVIADQNLPGLDGFSFAAAIRRLPGGTTVPFLLTVNGHVSPDPERLAYLHIDDVLVKPFERAALLARVRELLEPAEPSPPQSQLLPAPRPSAPSGAATTSRPPSSTPSGAPAPSPRRAPARRAAAHAGRACLDALPFAQTIMYGGPVNAATLAAAAAPAPAPAATHAPMPRAEDVAHAVAKALDLELPRRLPELVRASAEALVPALVAAAVERVARDVAEAAVDRIAAKAVEAALERLAPRLPGLVDQAVADAVKGPLDDAVRRATAELAKATRGDERDAGRALDERVKALLGDPARGLLHDAAERAVEAAIPRVLDAQHGVVEARIERYIRDTLPGELPAITEKVAWKVVPELAEDLVREEIRRLTEEGGE